MYFLFYLSLVQDLRISGLSGSKITKKILECESEERIENLLDVLMCLIARSIFNVVHFNFNYNPLDSYVSR